MEERTASLQMFIRELIDRKEEWQQLERKKQQMSVTLLISFVWLIFLIGCTVTFRSLPHEELLASPLRMLLIGVIIWAIFRMIAIRKKLEEQEESFEALRQEFIEKGAELFPDDCTHGEREALLAKMKQDYDINLYHCH